MYKVFFINFGYYSANESETVEQAKSVARAAGYQCHIEKDGDVILSYMPGAGFRVWYPDKPSSRDLDNA